MVCEWREAGGVIDGGVTAISEHMGINRWHHEIMSPLRVVFVAGCPRSGSTLLGRILGELEGWFDAGEVRNLWRYPASRICKCGRPHDACPVWGPATAAALDRLGELAGTTPTLDDAARLHEEVAASPRRFPLLWRAAHGRSTPTAIRAYAETLGAAYSALAETTGCRTIIDTSKLPSDLAAAALAPGVGVRVVLLVRDPRGFVSSRLRRRPDGTRLLAAVEEAAGWAALNAVAEAFARIEARGRWLAIRYEDLIADPANHVRRVADTLGPTLEVPIGHRTAHLSTGHALVGRRHWPTGAVHLEEDRRWERQLTAGQRRAITAVTAPVMARWRYLP